MSDTVGVPPEQGVQLFSHIIQAFSNAFATVQKQYEQDVIRSLQEHYFDKEGRPIYLDLQLPTPVDGKFVYNPVKIPKICLVPQSTIQISEAEINFNILLTGAVPGNSNDDTQSLGAAFPTQANGEGEYAKVRLVFKGGEPTEAQLRIQNQLLSLLP